MKHFILIAIAIITNSCNQENNISPNITITYPKYSDTIKFKQRSKVRIESTFEDKVGLKSFYYILNDSVFAQNKLEGEYSQFILDTALKHSGIYDYSIYVTNGKNLTSELHIPLLSDSVLRPTLTIFSSDSTLFPHDSLIIVNSEIKFIIACSAREYPLSKLTINNSSNFTLFEKLMDIKANDTILIEQLISGNDSLLTIQLLDSANFSSRTTIKFNFN